MKKLKKWIYLSAIFVLAILLVGTNLYWFKCLQREEEKLKNALIPTLSEDYYTRQLALTENAKKFQDSEYQEFMRYDEWYQETYYSNMGPKDVPLVNQNPAYPNGCEAASAVMLLNYYGIDITLKEFIDNYLPTSRVYEVKGVRYGPDPSIYYAGDPANEKRGWGTFDTVILNAMKTVIHDTKTHRPYLMETIALNENKYALKEFFQVTPALIWVTTDYQEVKNVYEWRSYDKKYTYTYPMNSHVVVLTGYDETYYYINDPLKEEKNIPVIKEQLEKSFDSLGRQAVVLDIYEMPEDEYNYYYNNDALGEISWQ